MTISLTYKPWAFYLVLVILAFVVVVTVISNALVLLALLRYPRLRSPANLLIGNLAVTDFLLALTVLPLSVANDTMGFWSFGARMCDVWLSMNVLCCTASTWGLVAIAFDRFTATKFPMWYRSRQGQRHVIYYILLVWVLPGLIFLPGLVGAGNRPIKQQEDEEEEQGRADKLHPTRNKSMGAHIFNPDKKQYECILFTEPYYIIFSGVCGILIPMIIMTFLYTRTFILIHTKQRTLSCIQRQRIGGVRSEAHPNPYSSRDASISSHPVQQPHRRRISRRLREYIDRGVKSCSTTTSATYSSTANQSLVSDITQTANSMIKLVELKQPAGESVSPITIITARQANTRPDWCPSALPESSSLSSEDNNGQPGWYLPPVKTTADRSWHPPSGPQTPAPDTGDAVVEGRQKIAGLPLTLYGQPESTGVGLSDSDYYTSQSASHATLWKDTGSQCKRKPGLANADAVLRRINQRERKATQRMAILVGVFILCWMPFALMFLIRGICGTDTCPDLPHVRIFVTWMGYDNSAINPVLYAFLNRRMKTAWLSLLQCRYR